MNKQETIFHIHGQKIAAKIWNSEKGIPTLALHGWLDNAASFDHLAPLLEQAYIIAIDLPGHGLSDHKPPGTFIHIMDFVINAIQVADHLGWKQFVLLGHSLGAAISSIIAGTIPHRIQGVALIDGLGPFTTPAEHTPHQLRLFIEKMSAIPNKTAPRYASEEEALQARLQVNNMQRDSAKALVKRGIKQVEDNKWTWRTDPQLLIPSAIQLTEEQMLSFLKAISSPICIVRPEPGFPFPTEIIQRRIQALRKVEIFRIAGQHHVHLDSPEIVAEHLRPFLENLKC